MAVTSIWRIKGYIGKVILYAMNPDKTVQSEVIETNYNGKNSENVLKDVIDYTARASAIKLISGVNCNPENASVEMMKVKQHFDKTDGVIAYHGYQSFAKDEVTPELAHYIGVELANRLWGDRHQVVVTTHIDKESHIHNHLIVNTVSFIDGKKYHRTKKDYEMMRQISDELCIENGLSVIQNPQSHSAKSYAEYEAEKKGETTKNDIFRRDIDECISVSTTMNEFAEEMESRGYSFDFSRKYVTVKHPDFAKPRRLKTLGEDYSEEAIRKRISKNWVRYRFEYEEQDNPDELFFNGIVFHDFQNVYSHFIFGLRTVKSRPANNRELHKVFADEILKLRRFDEEQRLMLENDLYTDTDITEYKEKCTAEMSELIEARRILRNKLKAAVRADDYDEQYELKDSIKTLSQRISVLRRDIQVSERLLYDEPVIEEKLKEVREHSDRTKENTENEHTKTYDRTSR